MRVGTSSHRVPVGFPAIQPVRHQIGFGRLGSPPRAERAGRVRRTVWTPQVPTESSRNLLSEPSRFGPSLVFVSVRMTNTRDSARPHGIPACQAAQLVVFWLERRASVVHRGDEHRVAAFWAGCGAWRSICALSLSPPPVSASPPRPRGTDASRQGTCLLSVPVLPLELHVFSTPRADCPSLSRHEAWSQRGAERD
jgi:hypothetical protein